MEYGRIAENEMIYLDEVSPWRKLKKAIEYIAFASFVVAISSTTTLPPNTPMNFESFQQYPLQVFSVWFMFAMVFVVVILDKLISNKISIIRDELGLHQEESLYLHAYETYTNIGTYIEETNPKRKLYFKRLALQSAKKLIDIVDDWKYGNVRLVAKLIGEQIDLLKNNMKRLVLSNVAKGDGSTLKKVPAILVELCRYIRSPSIEKLGELNDKIKELPYKEYKFLTKRERLRGYLYTKPRFFRLLFAGGITAIVTVILWCLNQNLGLIIAVAVPCFWGAFSGFDKLFGIKE